MLKTSLENPMGILDKDSLFKPSSNEFQFLKIKPQLQWFDIVMNVIVYGGVQLLVQ